MAENANPQWDTVDFNPLRQAVMQRFGCSEEEAIVRIQDMWGHQGENTRGETPRARTPSPHPPPMPHPPHTPRSTSPPNDIQNPTGKKNPFPEFEVGSEVADQIPLTPHEFALRKIKAGEYVELWYFTTEGCREASMATLTTDDETFGILKTNSGLALQQINTTKASRNAIADEHLSWDQIMTARHNLITAATTHGWPLAHTFALAKFYMNLENCKAAGTQTRPLIRYHATVRKTWHQALNGQGKPFDLSVINRTLLRGFEDQIRDYDQQELAKQASDIEQTID